MGPAAGEQPLSLSHSLSAADRLYNIEDEERDENNSHGQVSSGHTPHPKPVRHGWTCQELRLPPSLVWGSSGH